MTRLTISDLQRAEVVTEDGERLGHLFELAAREGGAEPPVVRALLVGRWGLPRRLGIGRGVAHDEVAVEDVIAVAPGRVVVRRRAG